VRALIFLKFQLPKRRNFTFYIFLFAVAAIRIGGKSIKVFRLKKAKTRLTQGPQTQRVSSSAESCQINIFFRTYTGTSKRRLIRSTEESPIKMGRKDGRYDREYKGSSSYTHSKWGDAPSRGRSRSRSDSPYRKRDATPPKRLQDRIERSISRTPSPSRRREEHSNGASLRTEGRTYSRLRSRSPSPARRRRDDSRSPVGEHRRHERSVTPVRPRKRQRSHSRSPSRSPSPYRDDSRSTQWRHKKTSKDSKRHRDRGKDSKSAHREHDVWKPSQSSRATSPSPRASRNRSPSHSASPRRSGSPSLRRDPPGTAGSTGRDYPTQRPSSLTVSGRGDSWRPAPTSPMHNRSQSPDKYTNHHRHSSSGYERPPSSTHSARLRSIEQPSTVRQLSEPRGNDQSKERPNRRRGMDYDRAEWDAWEAAQKEQERYIALTSLSDNSNEKSREAETNYQYQVPNDYPEHNATTPQVFEQDSAREERHPEIEPPREPRRRTPEGPRALYQGKNRQHHHNRRKDNYRNNSNQRNNHSREGFPRLPSQPAEQSYPGLQQYPERIQQQHPPQEAALPPPPPIQHELVTQSSEPPISSGTPTSAPPAPKPNGGIKPFTLKANVLKNLKRTQESDPEAERVLKSSRISPQHVIATSSTAIMPPPVPAEIQQTQTPETPSNQDATQERKPPTREKGASLFERIGQVGEGTYGKVYKAKNTLTGELVALKKIRMEAEKDGFPITAMREIKLLESLRHPNVIHLHEMMFEKSMCLPCDVANNRFCVYGVSVHGS